MLVIRELDPVTTGDDPSGWQTMRKIIGMWKDAPLGEPVARDHDKYLYGEEHVSRAGGTDADSGVGSVAAPTGSSPGGGADDDPTGWKAARRFIGLWRDAPADDLAEEHDDYLYGPEK